MTRELLAQLARFSVVGVVGFGIDGGLLYLLLGEQLDPYVARLFSFAAAVTVTWHLNRYWTFATRGRQIERGRGFRRYLVVQLTGAGCNYAVYALILAFVSHTPANALAALAVGSLVGLAINFTGARCWAFAVSTRPPLTLPLD